MASSIRTTTTTAMADPYRAWKHPWTCMVSGPTGLYNSNKMILLWIDYSKEKKKRYVQI